MNQSPPNHAPRSTAERLQRAANELPTARDEAAISRIMYAVRTRPQKSAARRLAPLNRPAWFAAAATAMVAVVVLTVTRPDAPGPSSPGPTPLPVRMGQDIDPLLARSENDLAQEMQSIRADLIQLSRMMTVRLESDPD